MMTKKDNQQPKHPWLWFFVLWLGGLITVSIIAYFIRFLMFGVPELLS